MFGSIDANKGDYQNGWDTDEFPTNIYEVTEVMLEIIQACGFTNGGVNFDAKTRRNSTDMEDIFIAHVSGMDTFARSLIIADKILKDSDFLKLKANRYASFDSGKGAEFDKGELSLIDVQEWTFSILIFDSVLNNDPCRTIALSENSYRDWETDRKSVV